MRSKRENTELHIFNLFACAIDLPENCAENRPPPEPDILFRDPCGSPRAFELVELIDQDYRHGGGLFNSTKRALHSHYERLPLEEKGLFDRKYGDALLYFRFQPNLTINQRRREFPVIFEKLLLLPDGFVGDALKDDPSLASLVDWVSISRGCSNGPIFDPEWGGWLGDPSVSAISKKLEKKYETKHPIELLAHINTNLLIMEETLPKITEFLDSKSKPLPFVRIWVFDADRKKVELQYEGTEGL